MAASQPSRDEEVGWFEVWWDGEEMGQWVVKEAVCPTGRPLGERSILRVFKNRLSSSALHSYEHLTVQLRLVLF